MMLRSKKIDDVSADPQKCLVMLHISAPVFNVFDPENRYNFTLKLRNVWFEYMFVTSLQVWELSAIKLYGKDVQTEARVEGLRVPSSRCPGWLVALVVESSPGYDKP